MPSPNSVPNILGKTVQHGPGIWLSNYHTYPWMVIAPILAFIGAVLALLLSINDRPGTAFIFSGITLAGVILTAGFTMFPFVMPSSSVPNNSLTMWDATSSHLTLTLMFWATLIFLPIVIAYTSWVYSVLRGKVTEEGIEKEKHSAY